MSVLLAVNNGERFLRAALDSVLVQTHAEFELVVVDDASTDATPAILDAVDDPRVRVFANEENLGLTRSLQRGLSLCRANLIARLDADDAMEPERLARQIDHLRRRPDVSAVGSWTTEVDADARVIGLRTCTTRRGEIEWELASTNIVYHPTVMFRRDEVEAIGGYDEGMPYAQDHDLWTRLIMSGRQVAVLPEPLTRYRRSDGQISRTRRREQDACGLAVRQRYLSWLLGSELSMAEVGALWRLMTWRDVGSGQETIGGARLAVRLRDRCVRDADARSARAITRRTRRTLLHHAAMLLRPSRSDRAAARTLLTLAMRLGSGSWIDPCAWKRAADVFLSSRRPPPQTTGDVALRGETR